MKKTLFAFCAAVACVGAFAQPMGEQKPSFDNPELPRARAECARTVGVEDLRDYHRCMTRMGFGKEIRAERRHQMRQERREERREDRLEDRRDDRQSFNPAAGMERGNQFDHAGRANRMEQQRQDEAGRPPMAMERPDRRPGGTMSQPARRIGAAECKAMTGGSPGIPSFDACMNANAAPQVALPSTGAPVLWQHPGAQR